MHWKLGSLVLGTLLVAFALSAPADATHSCSHECFSFYSACRNACGGDPICESDCADAFES